MGGKALFTQEQVKRALSAARKVDARSIVEIAPSGCIRILPEATDLEVQSDVDRWFANGDGDAG